jgi:hypothetical protein
MAEDSLFLTRTPPRGSTKPRSYTNPPRITQHGAFSRPVRVAYPFAPPKTQAQTLARTLSRIGVEAHSSVAGAGNTLAVQAGDALGTSTLAFLRKHKVPGYYTPRRTPPRRKSRASQSRTAAPRGLHGRTARRSRSASRLGDIPRTSGAVARAANALSRALGKGAGGKTATVKAAQRAIAPLKVKGRPMILPAITPIPSRSAELKLAQKQAAAAAGATRKAEAAAQRQAQKQAELAIKAEKVQARFLETNEKQVQKLHDKIQQKLERGDTKLKEAVAKAQKLAEKQRLKEAAAAAKKAGDQTLGEKAIDYLRGRLHMPSAESVVGLVTGNPVANLEDQKALERDKECVKQADRRRARAAKNAQCEGVPCECPPTTTTPKG